MLLVGCCIFLGADSVGPGCSLGEEGEREDSLCSLSWSESGRMGCVLRLSCMAPPWHLLGAFSAADFVLHPVLPCTQRLLRAKLSSSKGRINLLLDGSDMDRTAATVKTTKLAAFQSPAKLPLSPTHPLTKHIIQDVHDKLWTNKHICSPPGQQGNCILRVSELPKRINVR